MNFCDLFPTRIKMKTVSLFALALGLSAAEVILTKPGQTVTFTCDFKSCTTLVWSHGGIMIVNIDWKSGRNRKGTSNFNGRFTNVDKTLRVSSVKKEDAGVFSCTADKKREDHTLLVVSVSQSPPGVLEVGSEATLQCQVTGLSPGSVPHWKRPDGSLATNSTAQLKPVTDSYGGTWECLFKHGSVTYKESLVVKTKQPAPKTPAPLPSQKSDGDGHPSCIDCVSSSPPTQILLLPNMKWWIWVAIGVCGLVVIILVVVLIILCRRITVAKRKRRRRQNGHHPLEPRQYCQCNRPTAAAKAQQGRRREKPMALPRQPLLME